MPDKCYSGRLPAEFRNRTKAYASATIRLFTTLPRQRPEVKVLALQSLRAGTSVAAHIREASRARSTAEFTSKLGGAIQEADENALWLELLRENCGISSTQPLEAESSELIAIMTAMIRNSEAEKGKDKAESRT